MTSSDFSSRPVGLLVLGMHRSGTSAVTGMLERLGIPVPGELLPPAADNPAGFFENKAVYEFHDRLLAHLGARWDDPMPVSNGFVETPAGERFVAELAEIIQGELLAGAPIFAVKDPRMCRFVPLWRAALARLDVEPRAAISLRHPAEVADSLAKRNTFPRAKSFLLWLEHTLAAEAETRNMRRALLSYDGLLHDWRGAADRLAGELQLAWPKERGRVEAAIDAFLTPDLRHHAARAPIGEATRLDALVSAAWDALGQLAADEADEGARATLDAVREELARACAVLSPYVAWEFHALNDATAAADRLEFETTALRNESEAAVERHRLEREAAAERARQEGEAAVERARQDAERHQQESEAAAERQRQESEAAAERQRQDAERHRQESEAAVERLRHTEALHQSQLADERREAHRLLQDSEQRQRTLIVDQENELVHLRHEMGVLRHEADGLRHETGALRHDIGTLLHDIGTLRHEVNLRSAALDAVRHSTSWRLLAPLRLVGASLPGSVRTGLRRSLKAGWWVLTPWRMPARRRVFEARRIQMREIEAREKAELENRAPPTAHEAPVNEVQPTTPVPVARPETEDNRSLRQDYAGWVRRYDTLTDDDRDAIRRHLGDLPYHPLISVVVPVYNTPEDTLREMVASVQRQLYANWELCIADDASPAPHIAQILNEIEVDDPRVKWVRRPKNGHIAAASNTALELARGEFVALLDHDDLLSEHALYQIVAELNRHPDADVIYSDEDKLDENGQRYGPYFKPDFSYDLLLGHNVISHLGVYRRSLIEAIGGFRLGFEGSQDYDLALRAVAETSADKVRHIPAVLYHWRQERSGTSFSQANMDRCASAARSAIQDQLDRLGETGQGGKVLQLPAIPSWSRVKWDLPSPSPLVSIIIPTRDRVELLKQCLDGLLERTSYRNVEIIIVDNDSQDERTHRFFAGLSIIKNIRVVRAEGEFNYPHLNNMAAGLCNGEILLLLNNDINVIHHDWLDEMVSLVVRPDVGAVGAKLLYPDDRIQHAGVRLGAGRFDFDTGIAGHVGLLYDKPEVGYFGHLALTRDVGAVTAACLAIRRSVYEEVGGLDEVNLKVAFNDVDLCLKVRKAGYRILWTPHAELTHFESASRGYDLEPEKIDRFNAECNYMLQKWKPELMSDPFYSPNFDNVDGNWRLSFPPRRKQPWESI